MPDTLGSMVAEVQDWLSGERVPETRLKGAVNDACESLWKSLVLAALSNFMKGPVTLNLDAGAERSTVVSITDPTTAPTLSAVVSGALAAHTGLVKYTLVTESGTETLPSAAATLAVLINEVLSVASPAYVANAIGWNCYAYSNLGASTAYAKQNDEPILFGVAFQEPDTGFVNSPELPGVPVENTTGDDIFAIRHLESQLSNGAYRPWNGADIDSLMMRRFASTLAASSEYQTYAFDLINQRTLELRPATGAAVAPRYFYIHKPRRMRFANAALPFPTVPSTEFIRTYALSRIFLSLHEYKAAAAWASIAEGERSRCERALTATSSSKQTRVTPYRT